MSDKPEWIAVGEGRNIPEGIRVMFYHRSWGTSIGRWHGLDKTVVGLLDDRPTHWMPIPAPPDTGEGE